MPWDAEHGCMTPGLNGRGRHLGKPLTVEQIRELPDGAEVVITWSGGNGPSPYRILVDDRGDRRVETHHADVLAATAGQVHSLHRVTVGWDETTRAWFDAGRGRLPESAWQRWHQLRHGTPIRRAAGDGDV